MQSIVRKEGEGGDKPSKSLRIDSKSEVEIKPIDSLMTNMEFFPSPFFKIMGLTFLFIY